MQSFTLPIRIFLIAVFLISAQAVPAAQIKLSNGTVFNGDIISQNDNFIVLQVGQSKLSIAKSMIVEITGLPPGTTFTATSSGQAAQLQLQPPAAGNAVQPAARTADQGIAVPGARVEITLKTGPKYKGKVVSADERIITLEMDNGARLNIYKYIIADIRDLSPSPSVSAPSAVPPPAPVVAPVTPAAAPVARPAVSVSSAPVPVAPAAAAPVAPAISPVAASAPAAIAAPVIAPNPAMQTPAQQAPKPVMQAPVPQAPVTLTPIAPAPATPQAPENKPVSETPPVAAAQPQFLSPQATPPVPPVSAPPPVPAVAPIAPPQTAQPVPQPAIVPQKRADGKSEIMLKNGTVFTGTIGSENDRYLTFVTGDGATINILRRLIKSLDGVPYTAKPVDTSSQLQRTTPLSGSASQEREPKPAGSAAVSRRMMPQVAMRTDVSTAELADSLRSVSWEQRSSSARQLGVMGQWATGAVGSLASLFYDTVGQTALMQLESDSAAIQRLLPPGLEAARALSRIGPAGYDELKKTARSGNPLVRQRAVFGLGEAQDAGAQPLLREAIRDADPRVRAAAAHGLRFSDAVNVLIGALEDRDGDVRTCAAATLGELLNHVSVKALIGALKDVRPSVRMQAAAALGKMGAREAAGELAGAAADMSGEVREKAVIALGAIRDTAAVLPLLAALKDNEPAVRRAAAEALGDIRDPRAIPTLYGALQEPDPSVKAAIEIALKMHTEIPLLIGALDNQNSLVRDNAAYILWLMTGKDLGTDKQAWVEWYSIRGNEADTRANKKK